MASLFEGFEYDIFISYRQKDNKGNRWVSEFVEALKVELEATFKEDISIYFDENPHDGLLETHDVDASLEAKLKCLIFIPVISRTYCDPKSFAWKHEFIAFIEQAGKDQIGLKIKLPSGNVSTRVLPVRIHELDAEDTRLCESTLGSVLRGVDFIYKSPGVNRPLMANEEHPKDNLSKTYYRDQINKVANAADEIIRSLKAGKSLPGNNTSATHFKEKTKKSISKERWPAEIYNRITKKGLVIFLSVLLFMAGGYSIYRFIIAKHFIKTIAVIPYTFPRDDENLSESVVGYMDAIISKLQEVKNITVRHPGSSYQFLNNNKTPSELRSELKVNYLVEITVQKISNTKMIGIVLRETKGNRQIFNNPYNINEDQLLPLFSEIAQVITRNLDVEYSPEEMKNLETDKTKNPLAYREFLNGNARLFTAMGNKFVDSASFVYALEAYDKAIEADPGFAVAYAKRSIARSWGIHTGQLNSAHIEKCWTDIEKASSINSELPDVKIALGFYYYYCKKEYREALMSFKEASKMDPGNYEPIFYMAVVHRMGGNWEESQKLIKKVLEFNPQDPLYLTNIGLSYTYLHNYDSALLYHQRAIDLNPVWSASYLNKIETQVLRDGNTTFARGILDSLIRNTKGKHIEIKILLDIYDGKYKEAFIEADKTGSGDFEIGGNKYLYLGRLSCLLNNRINAAKYYDIAHRVLSIECDNDSMNAEIHSLMGIAYAGMGNREKAVAEGKKAIKLAVENKNNLVERDLNIHMAEIFTMLGLYDEAYSYIENALNSPGLLSVRLLQADPVWKPLLKEKKYNTLIAKYSKN